MLRFGKKRFGLLVLSGIFTMAWPGALHAAQTAVPAKLVDNWATLHLDFVKNSGGAAVLPGTSVDKAGSSATEEKSQEGEKEDSGIDWSRMAVFTDTAPVFLFCDNTLCGDVAAQADAGDCAQIMATGDQWYLLRSGDYVGFINKNTSGLLTGADAKMYAEEHFDKTATVRSQTAYVYAYDEETGVSESVIGVCGMGSELNVSLSGTGDYLAELPDGSRGAIHSEDIHTSLKMSAVSEPDMSAYTNRYEEALGTYGCESDYDLDQNIVYGVSAEACPEGSSFTGVVDYAMQFLGNAYVWGGEDLEHGVDCSGFIMQVYRHFGVSLPHSSYSMRNCGASVCAGYDERLVQPGDIICYEGHVALYIGDGQIIHAANKKDGIKISRADYRGDIICVRRIISGHGVWGDISEKEMDELCRIVQAEAGSESYQEKIYVADVVLNRVCSSRFVQNTITGVITAPHQFQPVANGRWMFAVPSDETIAAVEYALSHNDSSMGALYFMNASLADPENVEWFQNNLKYLFSTEKTSFFR